MNRRDRVRTHLHKRSKDRFRENYSSFFKHSEFFYEYLKLAEGEWMGWLIHKVIIIQDKKKYSQIYPKAGPPKFLFVKN